MTGAVPEPSMNGAFTPGSSAARDDHDMFHPSAETTMHHATSNIAMTRPTTTAAPRLRLRHAAAAALLAATPWLALAQDTTPTAPGTMMDMPRVIQHVASLGYQDIDEVERKGDKLFEIKARSPQGEWVEILVDARSGEVLRSEREDGPKHRR